MTLVGAGRSSRPAPTTFLLLRSSQGAQRAPCASWSYPLVQNSLREPSWRTGVVSLALETEYKTQSQKRAAGIPSRDKARILERETDYCADPSKSLTVVSHRSWLLRWLAGPDTRTRRGNRTLTLLTRGRDASHHNTKEGWKPGNGWTATVNKTPVSREQGPGKMMNRSGIK